MTTNASLGQSPDFPIRDAPTLEAVLAGRRAALSPRYAPPPVPLASRAIHGAALLLWILLFARALAGGGGVFAWSAGLAYILYDTALLGFVFVGTWKLRRSPPRGAARDDRPRIAARDDRPRIAARAPPRPTMTVIVAARNEATVLPVTLAALLAQTEPADCILVADDGSTDATMAELARRYGLAAGPEGVAGPPATAVPSLRLLRLPPGGKARALNRAVGVATTGLVLTVDADTLLDPPALAAMRDAFAADPALVAATGVLKPICGGAAGARLLQWFQTYEYVRNFLSRFAWMETDALLLISGAFGCYRRDALLAVGGFDPDCLVEDYELTHRLRDHAGRCGVPCHTAVIGGAHARTDAPSTARAFLQQRRRWFGGFLQTQLWYRHMVGNARYGATGLVMLPVKAVDTLQPLYGLTGAALLAFYLLAGRLTLAGLVFEVIGAKLALDVAFHLWSLRLYRRWVGDAASLRAGPAVLASLIEPFSFQLLRHVGAALGWVTFLRGNRSWGGAARLGVLREAPRA